MVKVCQKMKIYFKKQTKLRKQKQNEKRKRKSPPAGIGPDH